MTDFIVFNYFCGETKPNDHYKKIKRSVLNVYCLGLKGMFIRLNSIMKPEAINDLFKFLLTDAKYINEQLFLYNEAV